MWAEAVHWVALAAGGLIGARQFRDLGDITQAFFTVERKNLLAAIRWERPLMGVTIGLLIIALAMYLGFDAGFDWLSPALAFLCMGLVVVPWLWVHVGLRGQQFTARYEPVSVAFRRIRSEESVLVVEHNGQVYAFTDFDLKRPHIAGLGHAGGPVMTYCALSRLGIAFVPEKGQRLEVAGQHGNNLIIAEMRSGECLQQIYGRNDNGTVTLDRLPVWRMSFAGYAETYPDGLVFLNPSVGFLRNPVLWLFDHLVEVVFLVALREHHHSEALLFNTLSHEDTRLPRKTLVWGVVVNGEAAAFTREYVIESGGALTTEIGGTRVSVACDPHTDDLVVRTSGTGARVKTLCPGMYWFAWVNFHPDTRLNTGWRTARRTWIESPAGCA